MFDKEEIQEMIEQKANANEVFLKHPTLIESTAKIDRRLYQELMATGFNADQALILVAAHIQASK